MPIGATINEIMEEEKEQTKKKADSLIPSVHSAIKVMVERGC